MPHILACIDNSSYANSVCDHAGWFASDPDVGVEVLHVVAESGHRDHPRVQDRFPTGDPLVDRAVWRLREEGVGPVTCARTSGSFVEVATQRNATVIVMGKRGDGSAAERSRLGSSVDAMVRATDTPLCLTSKLYLPIRRAVVLLDAEMSHLTAIDFAATEPRLRGLPMDLVVAHRPDTDPNPKVELARARLNAQDGDVFALQADGLDHAVTQYMASRAVDLVIVSRTVVGPDPEAGLRRIEETGLWGTRTPVLIC
jgi:nucleotide-binding universal stress UspA family protein